MKTIIAPDKEKAKALIKMANETLQRLNTTKIEEYPSNSLTDYYDIIHKLAEALTIIQGIKFRGEGAHKELIDYVFKDNKKVFLQEMRDYRNRISYEGFMINKNYIEQNKEKIIQIINRLFELNKKTLIN